MQTTMHPTDVRVASARYTTLGIKSNEYKQNGTNMLHMRSEIAIKSILRKVSYTGFDTHKNK